MMTAKFGGAVGVAPSTTTIYYPYATPAEFRSNDGLGVIDPNDWWYTGNPFGLPGTSAFKITGMDPGPMDLLGLGIVNPEVQRTINGLGAIPTDAELSKDRGYTPVHSGWIYATSLGDDTPAIDKWAPLRGWITTAAIAVVAILAITRGDK